MPLPVYRPRWTVDGKAVICRSILTDLPAWFGRADAVDEYCRQADALPMLSVTDRGEAIGFASLRNPTPANTEIHVMGVRPCAQRQGVGCALVETAGRHAHDRGQAFLSVKTIGPSSLDPHYHETRAFYDAVGFVPIDELTDFWGPGLPMLLMIKTVS